MPNARNRGTEKCAYLQQLSNLPTFNGIGQANLEVTRNQENSEKNRYQLQICLIFRPYLGSQ